MLHCTNCSLGLEWAVRTSIPVAHVMLERLDTSQVGFCFGIISPPEAVLPHMVMVDFEMVEFYRAGSQHQRATDSEEMYI